MSQINDEEKLYQFIGQLGKIRFLPIFTMASPLCMEYGFTEEHVIALAKIVLADDPFVSYIASVLYITTSKASRIVKYLEEIEHPVKGKIKLVQRKYGEAGDLRKIKLIPTKEGKELFGKLWTDLLIFIDEILKEVGEKEINKLISLLEKFNDIAEKKIKTLLDPGSFDEGCKD
ncbi:MAG: MarR family transcriptional regulator [Candidatus Heimdallarchaeota archaeon]|nr:MAG: MarR family transcriptional regulator [Candidatus Heimdallarchaeota archaeon]